MILISELKGNKIKKAIGAENVNKRYHNKNKHGGNFGFTIRKNKKVYDLYGVHNTEGHVSGLRFAESFHPGMGIPIMPSTFDALILSIERIIQAMADYEVMNK